MATIYKQIKSLNFRRESSIHSLSTSNLPFLTTKIAYVCLLRGLVYPCTKVHQNRFSGLSVKA